MSSFVVTALLWISALSGGLMAGVYFAFSGFIMQAFDNTETSHAIIVMNSINERIQHSLFMPLFFGSSIVSVLLMIFTFVYWTETGSIYMLFSGLVYFVGMFACTVIFNVPLNGLLAKQDAGSEEAKQVWLHYRQIWTRWNDLRVLSSLVMSMLSVWLLTAK